MPFQHTQDLTGLHTARITALAFSPLEPWLASGDDNGLLIVWDVKSGNPLYDLSFNAAIVALTWDFARKDRIFVGLESGAVHVVDDFRVRGLKYSF